MAQVARNHHFIAQCYLAGFTDTGTKEGRLCVCDLKAGRFFRQKPGNVAFELDFNRVEVEGHPPDVLETAFGELEGRAASVIRRIVREQEIPEGEEFSYVLNMIALLAVRNPVMRRTMTVSQRHMYRVIGDLLASDATFMKAICARRWTLALPRRTRTCRSKPCAIFFEETIIPSKSRRKGTSKGSLRLFKASLGRSARATGRL